MSLNNNIQRNWTTRVASRLFLTLTLTLGTLAIPTIPVKADEPAPRNRLTGVEISLLRDFIDGHSFAVQMSQECVEKATRAELKSLCEEVITAQQQQIQMMQSWLRDWYGIEYTPTSNKFGMNVLNQLESLSGSEFEITFMKTLTSHHWGAIQLVGQIIDRAYHHQFVELGSDAAIAQVDEINHLRKMLLEVYGIEYNGSTSAGSAAVDPEPSLLAPGASR